MLELAVKNNVKGFLLTSTSEVYGQVGNIIPTPETFHGLVNSYGPRSMYDEGKRAAEAYAYSFFQKYQVPIRIARIFNTYGPRLDVNSTSQYGRVIVKFISQALSNSPITVYGDGNQTRSFCYITDLIEGLMKLLLSPGLDGMILNLGNQRETKILDIANLIIKLVNSNSSITFKPLPEDDPLRRSPDLTNAKKLLKFSNRVDLEDGLSRTIDWMKEADIK